VDRTAEARHLTVAENAGTAPASNAILSYGNGLKQILVDFQDHLAPRLDTYEQAIYLYIFRHTRLIGIDEAVIGFKSVRKRMACGIGTKGTPMSEGSAYEKLKSLHAKGCIEIVASERAGQRLRLRLPEEIPGVVVTAPAAAITISLEEVDFFAVPENRAAMLKRENNQCFYCLRKIDPESYVIEHVVSRPTGKSNYRNVVAACRQCNNRKNDSLAEDYLRTLYRNGFLDQSEFEGRLTQLALLCAGGLKQPAHF